MEKKVKTLQKVASIRCFNFQCNKINAVNKRCSRCNHALYCSPECQKVDWPHHKRMCKFATTTFKEKSNEKFSDKELDNTNDSRNIYKKWKVPRIAKIARLADHLLPGNKWEEYFLFWPLLVNEDKEVELQMNSWHYYKINDDSDDSKDDLSSVLPVSEWRRQAKDYRTSIPSHLTNFRQALIFVLLLYVSDNNDNKVRFTTFLPVGINAGSVPGTENIKDVSTDNIMSIVNSLNNTPWDHIPSDNDK